MKTNLKNLNFATKALIIVAIFINALSINANNLTVNVVGVTTHPSDTQRITFTVSWDQSWRTTTSPYNWDGVWLFVKVKNCGSGTWEHGKLSPVFTDHTAKSPLEVDTAFSLKDGLGHGPTFLDSNGIMLRRASADTGNIVNDTITFKLVNIALGDHDYKVFGVEMVYIPTGAFYLGDGSLITTPYVFRYGATNLQGLASNDATPRPYLVQNENAITCSNAGNNLWSVAAYTPVNPIPATYPKGYQDFYCMKYEISQGQYAEFLNNIDNAQATNRYYISSASRYTLSGTWPNLAATAESRAINFLSWYDLCAYLDWACLRPMTEMEFEKAARGTADPVKDEYAWGSTSLVDANSIVSGTDGQFNERVDDFITPGSGIANFNNNTVLGPLRCGYASSKTTTRQQAGAGFYGVMELSGNVSELCVNTNEALGVSFTRLTGDGTLTSVPPVGDADVANWPSAGSGVLGACIRGGSWVWANTRLRISDRFYQTNTFGGYGRSAYIGGRGVR
ncbi:MAG: hypothetical protein A2X12_05560 [Bacteroidetes bacterium GWE2_29_8]|nr:MAG: hypothetical protein A2X12_05560 [Bacteroidetes bacterium GWE2_29_8]